jgi:glycosyltransferase involved in cell wall biosynthesis
MDISLLICTFNRADSLRKTLESVQALEADSFSWEVIAVDNNSSDGTPAVVHKFADSLDVPVRYVFEPRQGLAFARNRGVQEAKGSIVAFTDDDVTLSPYWLARIHSAFTNPEIGIVGGPILPVWPSPPPRWLTPELYGNLALLDRGNDDVIVDDNNLWGANLAIRRALFEEHGLFDTSLGRTPGKLYAGEETELLGRMRSDGEKAFYCSTAAVHHRIPENRMTKAYFRKWRMDNGALVARRQGVPGSRRLFRVPLYIYRTCLTAMIGAAFAKIRGDSEAFLKEVEVYYYLGIMRALVFGHSNKTVNQCLPKK